MLTTSCPTSIDPKYISDLHLFDASSLGWRPLFSDVYSYADFIIDNWNRFTNPDEIVFIVGDIGHYCQKTIEVLQRLNGHKLLILGNHDTSWGNTVFSCGCFVGVYKAFDLESIHIQHIPEPITTSYTWYVHGHHHRYDMPGMYKALQLYAADTYRLNCSTDINNHRPCTLQELLLNKEVMLDNLRESGILQEV